MKRTQSLALLTTALAVLLAATLSAVTPTAQAAPSSYTVTFKAGKAKTQAKAPITLAGTVRPAAAGTSVVLQKRLAGKNWVKESTTKLGSAGRFSFTDRPSTAGQRQYRVVVAASARGKRTYSKPVSVTVYRWVPLLDISRRDSARTLRKQSISINGTDRGGGWRSYQGSRQGFVDWNFGRHCLSLRARYGNADDGEASSIANISVTADGESIYAKSFALTRSEFTTLNVSQAFRVAFTWTSSNPDDTEAPINQGADAAMVSAEVYCAF